jgi:hypothetical protein
VFVFSLLGAKRGGLRKSYDCIDPEFSSGKSNGVTGRLSAAQTMTGHTPPARVTLNLLKVFQPRDQLFSAIDGIGQIIDRQAGVGVTLPAPREALQNDQIGTLAERFCNSARVIAVGIIPCNCVGFSMARALAFILFRYA